MILITNTVSVAIFVTYYIGIVHDFDFVPRHVYKRCLLCCTLGLQDILVDLFFGRKICWKSTERSKLGHEKDPLKIVLTEMLSR